MFINTANSIDGTAMDDRLPDPASLIGWAERVGLPVPRTNAPANLGAVNVADIRRRIRISFESAATHTNTVDEVRSMIDELASRQTVA